MAIDETTAPTAGSQLESGADTVMTETPPDSGDAGRVESGAPESYGDFELPQGIEVDERALGRFHELARDYNLSQQQAQQLVSLQSEFLVEQDNARREAWDLQQQEWVDQGKRDRQFGGDSYAQSVQTALLAIDKIGTPELKEALNQGGMGNHPEMIRVFWKIGKLLQEDTPVGRTPGSVPSRAETLYPDK